MRVKKEFNLKQNDLIFIRSTPIEYDSRSRRTLEFLEGLQFNVRILSWSRERTQTSNPDVYSRTSEYGAGIRNLLNHAHFNFWLARKLFQTKPKIIYAADSDSAISILIYRLFHSPKIILDEYDFLPNRINSKVFKLVILTIDRLLKSLATLVIYPSLDRLQLYPDKSIVIPNTELEHTFENLPKSENSIFYGGMLLHDRGLNLLVDFARNNPGWHITVVGFGPLTDFISEQSRKIVNLRYLGPLSHRELMSEASSHQYIWAMYDPSVKDNSKIASNKLSEAAYLEIEILSNFDIGIDYLQDEFSIARLIRYGNIEDLQDVLGQKSKTEKQFQRFLTEYYNGVAEHGKKSLESILKRLVL